MCQKGNRYQSERGTPFFRKQREKKNRASLHTSGLSCLLLVIYKEKTEIRGTIDL
jgi:hypothetical protein